MKYIFYCLFILSCSAYGQNVKYVGISELTGTFYMVLKKGCSTDKSHGSNIFIYSKNEIPYKYFNKCKYKMNQDEVYLLGLHTDVWYFLRKSDFSKNQKGLIFTKTIDSLLFDYSNYGFNFIEHSLIDSYYSEQMSYKAYYVNKEQVFLFNVEKIYLDTLFDNGLSRSMKIKSKLNNIKVGIVFNNNSDLVKTVNDKTIN